MPRRVRGPDGILHSFPDDATDDEVRAALGGDQEPPKPVRVEGDSFGDKISRAADLMGWSGQLGALKGAAKTVTGLGELAVNAGMIPGVTPAGLNPSMRNPLFQQADEATAYRNAPERIGGAVETAAELAIPAGEAASAIPSAARAGQRFQSVMSAAKTVPIDVEGPGQVALRVAQLAERGGGSLPRPVSQLLQRMTNPDKTPIAYEEARDFASGISRLSANEAMRMGPAVAREVAGLRVALNKSVADAAAKAGQGAEHAKAMTEYAKAKRLESALDDVVSGVKKGLPYAGIGTALGGSSWLTKQIVHLLGGE